MTGFSIIIPTWNNLPYLKECIRSLQQNSQLEHQVLVHVNENKDNTCQWLSEQGIAFTHSQKNIGICHAVNLVADLATQPNILYLNDDMYVLPDWDIALQNAIRRINKDIWMLSGTLIEPKFSDNTIVIHADFGTSLETFREKELLESYKKIEHSNWNGSTWPPVLMPRQCWLKVGGFSSEFSPGMYSDPDLSMKMWQIGCRDFLGVAECRVYHFQAKSTGRVVKNDGRKQFKQKWGISARAFYKHFLKMGQPYSGTLPEPEKNMTLWFEKIRAKYF